MQRAARSLLFVPQDGIGPRLLNHLFYERLIAGTSAQAFNAVATKKGGRDDEA